MRQQASVPPCMFRVMTTPSYQLSVNLLSFSTLSIVKCGSFALTLTPDIHLSADNPPVVSQKKRLVKIPSF